MSLIIAAVSDGNVGVANSLYRSALLLIIAAACDGNVDVENGLY